MKHSEILEFEERLKKLKEEHGSEYLPDDVIDFCEVSPRNIHLTIRIITGPKISVIKHIAYIIEHDRVTPMYEHMRWRILDFKEKGDTLLYVKMSKNHYAGD